MGNPAHIHKDRTRHRPKDPLRTGHTMASSSVPPPVASTSSPKVSAGSSNGGDKDKGKGKGKDGVPQVSEIEDAPAGTVDISDIDKILAAEASTVTREEECTRVLSAFKLNPYDVLGVDLKADDNDIRKCVCKSQALLPLPLLLSLENE